MEAPAVIVLVPRVASGTSRMSEHPGCSGCTEKGQKKVDLVSWVSIQLEQPQTGAGGLEDVGSVAGLPSTLETNEAEV